MKVHIYTDIHNLFDRACRLWMDVLLGAGHEVEYVDIGMEADGPLPDVGPCDVNLLIVGVHGFRRFNTVGLPTAGKHLLWMFDPLTREKDATIHQYKTVLFDELAPSLHGVMAMDSSIKNYLGQHYPGLQTSLLPYLIDEKYIRPPLPETARQHDAVMMGSDTPRRREAEQYFRQAGVPADFIWRGLWGREREACRAGSRVCLNIHADSNHTYFDQFRAFETWADGTAVLSDAFVDGEEFGVLPGRHLTMAELQDLPAACAGLLADAPRREALIRASQALLRERFTPAVWRGRMLDMITALA